MKGEIEGAWELLSGQPLPEGARDIKILSGGRFIFTAFDMETGQPLYTAGGAYTLNGRDYVERLEFASDQLAELIGKDQSFVVSVDGDIFTQTGTLTNGKALVEKFKRLN